MDSKIIQRGAEAVILREKSYAIKKRVKKSYRISEIDEKIRKLRTRSENKLLKKASKIISTPHVFDANEGAKEITLEFIEGKKLSEELDKFPRKEQQKICQKMGKEIGKLHSAYIIHGDLTTSNMILKKEAKKKNSKENLGTLYLIDFGLGFISRKYEDGAVDIHLLKQALEAKHFKHWKELFKEFIKGYKKTNRKAKIVLERLGAVEKRGRYRH